MDEVAQLRLRVKELELANQQFAERDQLSAAEPSKRGEGYLPRKDMSLQAMVSPWSGEEGSIPVAEFVRGIELVAESGHWEERDKALVLRMRLKGQAASFLASRLDLQEAEVSYDLLKQALIGRFRDELSPQHHLLLLNTMSQSKGEGVRAFADRCRAAGQRALPRDLAEDEVIGARKQIERVVLTAFMNGLRGEMGRSLRVSPPSDLEEAINRATLVEREELKGGRGDVFVVYPGTVPEAFSEASQGMRVVNQRPLQKRGLCFHCRREGHIARDCPGRAGPVGPASPPARREGRECFRCGLEGHFARDCRGRPQGRNGPPVPPPRRPDGNLPRGAAPRQEGILAIEQAPNGDGAW